nr:aryldialkylphosphatase [Lysinibacter cavernae]
MNEDAQSAQRGVIRTVRGDIDPSRLGRTNYHEHLFQVSPMLPGDELDDESKSLAEAGSLREAATDSMIEATPLGLGRNPAAVARISSATGLQIVHVTGAHHSGHYADDHPIRSLSVAELTARFSADVVVGMTSDETRPVRAGMIKAGIRYWQIGPFEQRVLEAVGAAHSSTGAPVMVHLDYGSAAHEVAEILDRYGVRRERIVLAHMDRNLDAGLHADLIASGLYLGYDGPARHREAPDEAILDCLARVVSQAGADRLLLGGDVARASRYRSYGGLPGLDYVGRRFVPRLEDALGAEATERILVANPARLLTMPAS